MQEQMWRVLQAIQQKGALGGTHEDLLSFGSWTYLWYLQQTLPIFWLPPWTSHWYISLPSSLYSLSFISFVLISFWIISYVGPLPKQECKNIFSFRGCRFCLTILESPNARRIHQERCQLSNINSVIIIFPCLNSFKPKIKFVFVFT